jgi:hypothetical protein
MTLTELKIILEATGFPVAYSHFVPTNGDPVPDPPYICYLSTFSSNMKADNKVYKQITNVQIELYTKKKDLLAESTVETVLFDNEIPWESSEIFIDTEELFQKIYEVRLL